jgi:hypothetical protein
MRPIFYPFWAGVAFSALTLVPLSASANDNATAPAPPRPPQEAVDACANLSDGATCTLSFHGQTIEGNCHQGPTGQDPLACVPPPPPEAIEACASLKEGATCTVTHHGHTMPGTCRNPPSGETGLACAPQPPRR